MGTGASGVTGLTARSPAGETGPSPGTGPATTPPPPTGVTIAPLLSRRMRPAPVALTTAQVSQLSKNC